MHFTQVEPTQRLQSWRTLRKKFNNSSNICDVVSNVCIVPEKVRYIDYYTPKNWPTPFEIVSEGMFCQSGISIVLAATLIDIGFINTKTIRFDVISSQLESIEGLVLKVDKQYCNFIPGQISTEEEVQNYGTIFDSHIITVDKLFA